VYFIIRIKVQNRRRSKKHKTKGGVKKSTKQKEGSKKAQNRRKDQKETMGFL
jgi:hypothetical protein